MVLGLWPSDGTDTLVNIESLSFSDRDVALGNASVISTIIPTVSLPSVSSTRVDVSAKLESLKAGLPNAPTLPSLMDAASSGLSGPSSTTSSTDATGSSVGEVLQRILRTQVLCRYGIFCSFCCQ